MKGWLLYCCLLVFAIYWASNLFLWYPWSYSETMGMILMLTISPLAWAFTVYLALVTYPGPKLFQSALYTAVIFLLIATVLDFVFFGIIRNAMEELYHPTTLYGYVYLAALPFVIAAIFKKRIQLIRSGVKRSNQLKALIIGLLCLLVLILIIIFDLRIV